MNRWLRTLWDRLRYPKTRADELLILRQRFEQEGPVERFSEVEHSIGNELLVLRTTMLEATGPVSSCSSCAKGCPLPHGQWDGGYCCSGNTEAIFSQDEVSALLASGTNSSHLVPPKGSHAGCAFRGPVGCSLAPQHRPNLCLSYLCNDLFNELAMRGDYEQMEEHSQQIKEKFNAFVEARKQRLAQEEVSLWEEELRTM